MLDTDRPAQVSSAVKILYGTVGIGLLRSIIEGARVPQDAPLDRVLCSIMLTIGFMLFNIYMIGQGKNWARILFLVLFVLGLPVFFLLLMVVNSFASPLANALGFVQMILQAIAIFVLFHKDSSSWFRSQAES